jgi:hypothetical protein
MKNISRLEEIRKATMEAVERYRVRREAMAGDSSRPAAPGDMYLFPGPFGVDLVWVIVGVHPEQPLLFAVPGDGHPLVGLTDVEVARSRSYDPLALRCGYGLWIHRDEFRSDWRIAAIEERYVRRAQDKLGQIGAGKIEGSASQRECEANPDYDEWLGEVECAADRLASALRIKEETITAADFKEPMVFPASEPALADAEPHFALAAASAGPLARLYEAIQADAGNLPLAKSVDYLYPGNLFLLLEPHGLAVVFVPHGSEMPPELHVLGVSGQATPASWLATPRRTASRATIRWESEGTVRLRFGRGEHAKDITVQK